MAGNVLFVVLVLVYCVCVCVCRAVAVVGVFVLFLLSNFIDVLLVVVVLVGAFCGVCYCSPGCSSML